MFTPSEDELHRRGMRSTLLSQDEQAFSIAFYAIGRKTTKIFSVNQCLVPAMPGWGRKNKGENTMSSIDNLRKVLEQQEKMVAQILGPMKETQRLLELSRGPAIEQMQKIAEQNRGLEAAANSALATMQRQTEEIRLAAGGHMASLIAKEKEVTAWCKEYTESENATRRALANAINNITALEMATTDGALNEQIRLVAEQAKAVGTKFDIGTTWETRTDPVWGIVENLHKAKVEERNETEELIEELTEEIHEMKEHIVSLEMMVLYLLIWMTQSNT